MHRMKRVSADIARSVIEQIGRPATFTRPAAEYDPATGSVDRDETEWTGRILVLTYSVFERAAGGGRIEDGDVKGLCVTDTEPRPGDEVTLEGGRRRRVQQAGLDASEAYYELQLRRI